MPTNWPAATICSARCSIGRVLAAAEMLGMAGQAFETTLAYLKQRVQFGQVLATFQALQYIAWRTSIATSN